MNGYGATDGKRKASGMEDREHKSIKWDHRQEQRIASG